MPPGDRNLLIETANENTRGVLRPIGGISNEGNPGAVAKLAKVLPQPDQDYDDIDLIDGDELLFGSNDGVDFEPEAAEDDPPKSEVPAPKPPRNLNVQATARRPRPQISLRAVAAHVPVHALVPNADQVRTALGLAAIVALVLSLAVAYHLPTSAYGLKALAVIATVSMGLSVLAWPLRLRLLTQCALAVSAAAIVHFGKPTNTLAEMRAELQVYASDPIARGNAARTLAVLGRRDFTGLDLRGANLSGLDLSFTLLRGADLRSADLSYSNLSHAQLTLAKMTSADFGSANLLGTNMNEAVDYVRAHCDRRTKMPLHFTCESGRPTYGRGALAPGADPP